MSPDTDVTDSAGSAAPGPLPSSSESASPPGLGGLLGRGGRGDVSFIRVGLGLGLRVRDGAGGALRRSQALALKARTLSVSGLTLDSVTSAGPVRLGH